MKHGAQWGQKASASFVVQFRSDIQRHRESLAQGQKADRVLMEKYEKFTSDINFLASGQQKLEDAYTAILMKFTSSPDANLLDLPVHDFKVDQELVTRVDQILQLLQRLKKDRQAVLADLKEKVRFI